jgi:hypothetical protein
LCLPFAFLFVTYLLDVSLLFLMTGALVRKDVNNPWLVTREAGGIIQYRRGRNEQRDGNVPGDGSVWDWKKYFYEDDSDKEEEPVDPKVARKERRKKKK